MSLTSKCFHLCVWWNKLREKASCQNYVLPYNETYAIFVCRSSKSTKENLLIFPLSFPWFQSISNFFHWLGSRFMLKLHSELNLKEMTPPPVLPLMFYSSSCECQGYRTKRFIERFVSLKIIDF